MRQLPKHFMTRPEEMLAEHQTMYFHDSTFVELEDGRLLHASRQKFSTSTDGGVTWSETYSSVDRNGQPVGGGGSSLVKLSGNGIGLVGQKRGQGRNHPDWMEQFAYMVFWRSEDGGKTWEPPVRMTRPGIGNHAYQDTAVRTSGGRIIVPVYVLMSKDHHPADPEAPNTGKLVHNQWYGTSGHFYDPALCANQVYYSDDDGRSWKVNRDGEILLSRDYGASAAVAGEPSVAEVSPGKLIMVMRTPLGRLFQAWSYDNGETWSSPAPTNFASSTVPAQIRRIPSTGHLLIVWNQEGHEDTWHGFNRMRVSSAISRNGGSVWEFYQNITSRDDTVRVEPGPIEAVRPLEVYQYRKPEGAAFVRPPAYVKNADIHLRCSYPSVYVGKDKVIVTHTYTHIEEHPTKAQLIPVGGANSKDLNQLMKVLPLSWFYGGKDPAESTTLPRAGDVATP